MPKCIKCEKDLVWDDAMLMIEGAGFVVVSFHYGSRHDQLGTPDKPSKINKLLRCDEIRAFLCDDCFEQHIDLFEGWTTEKITERKV